MLKNQDLSVYVAVFGFCLGNVYSFLASPTLTNILLLLVLALCFVSARILFHKTHILHTLVYLAALVYFFVALSIAHVMWHQSTTESNPLGDLAGTQTTLTAIVTEEADVRDFNTRLTVDLTDHNTRALVVVPHYPRYTYGDQLLITGTFKPPESFTGDTGRVFDYTNFLAKDDIRYIARFVEIEIVSTGQGNPIKAALLATKHSFLYQINQILPEPHSSFLGGLLVGAKSSMGTDMLDDFRDTGIIHIVVLSGFNVTIVAEAIMRVLSFFGAAVSATFGSLGILFFAIMTGASSTIIRASLMAFLVIIARVTGNHARVMRMLFIAGLLMLLVNPMLLLYDPGFQLSFLATLGLISFTPFVERFLPFIPKKIADFRGLAAATIATQIMVTPLILYSMGTLPVYAPLVNLLVLAGVPWVMGTGFFAGLLSYVSTTLAFPFTFITYYILEYFLMVVQFFLSLPFATFTIPPFSFSWVILAYCIYALIAVLCISVTNRN